MNRKSFSESPESFSENRERSTDRESVSGNPNSYREE